jgi:ligand-binding sensor domain-containing protein/signal transduction histidine kinase
MRSLETVRGRGKITRYVLLACIVLACSSCVFALDPALDISQYARTSWKVREGFTKGSINSIAQTPDGYLWLGTEFGLLRFDGIKTVPWQPPPDRHLPSNYITNLFVARDGTLWISTDKGLASWKDGQLTEYPTLAGPILPVIEDREGSIWVGTYGGAAGRLCVIRNGSVQCYGEDGRLGQGVLGLYEDSKGNLWAGVPNGLWRWKPSPPKFYPLPDEPNGIRGFGEADDGALLIGTTTGIRRVVDGKTEAYPLSGTVRQFRAKKLLRDRDGSLWIGTQDQGLVHLHQGRTDVFAQADGLSGDNVGILFEDREGNIWVATYDGLDRFRDLAVATFSVNQGLSNAVVTSVLAAKDGSVWLGTQGGLNRWNNGQMTIYPERRAQSVSGSRRGTPGNVREIIGSGLPDYVMSFFQDDRGRILVSTNGGVGYLENDRFISISNASVGNVSSIVQDTAGNLWIANQNLGLIQLLRGGEVQQIPWARLGRKDPAAALVVDRLQGGLWLGFSQSDVAYFSDGQLRATYAAADGLGEGRVSAFQFDQDGTLWAATAGGLSRLKNGRVATLTSQNGLPCDAVHWVMEDDDHSFWLLTACGLVRIARSELDAWAAVVDKDKDAKRAIQATVFDSSDGVRSRATAGGYTPHVAKSPDGKLWFASPDGVSVFDPRHLPFNSLSPPVQIEQITADRKTYDATLNSGGPLRLPPLSRDLEIDYTALSLVAPEKILFRYKLEGYDGDWQDAGNRRQAFYTNLGPRTYRFRVMACNNSGVWNEVGTYLDITIAPAYYQTTWFRILLGVLFLTVLGAIYQLRLRQVARQVRGRMEERLDERERIARDLHDTLLQSVQGLILKFHAVAIQMPAGSAGREALEKTLDHADDVLTEGRDRLRNLRATSITMGGLPTAFSNVAQETPNADAATFKTVVEGRVLELHPMVREESFCIGREAIVNALTHSGGRHLEVEIIYDRRQFCLRVRDDGRGIDPKLIAEGRPDHWGLRGMKERTRKIGGQLNFWSRPETGTEVELTIPGATAYVNRNGRSWKSRFRRTNVVNGKKHES